MDKRNTLRNTLVVTGPTATGKSTLAIRLAKELPGEVLSADSMQIYRGMDIGTAKVSREEETSIPHHLLSIREPGDRFSVAEYQDLARSVIESVLLGDRTPVLVGGTALYIDSVLYNYEYRKEDTTSQREISAPTEQLWAMLQREDPASAKRLHPNDRKRIMRALAYWQIHGKSIADNLAAKESPTQQYPAIWIGLILPREDLYARINQRVDQMMEQGLLHEVEGLRDAGLHVESQAGQAIGYKQLLDYLAGTSSLEEAVERIKRESRRYAKRQLSWLRKKKEILWLDAIRVAQDTQLEKDIAILRHGSQEAVLALCRRAGLLYEGEV